MTAVSSDLAVRRAARSVPAADAWATEALLALRDAEMAGYLRCAAGEGTPELHASYRPRWWDGDAWSPCLDLEWRGTRWRVLRDDDELVYLPAGTRRARRLLRRRRRVPPTPPLAPLLSGQVRPAPVLPEVQLLPPGDPRGVAALRRERNRRRYAGPSPEADPRQGVLQFGTDTDADEPEQAPAPVAGDRVVVVEQQGDWLACRHPSCGGLRLLPAPGTAAPDTTVRGTTVPDDVCPRCGRR